MFRRIRRSYAETDTRGRIALIVSPLLLVPLGFVLLALIGSTLIAEAPTPNPTPYTIYVYVTATFPATQELAQAISDEPPTTLAPTTTAVPTEEPSPTARPTQRPTSTPQPRPTDTPLPPPTRTPEPLPTWTPAPLPTAVPTAELPTAVPPTAELPTPVPTAAPVGEVALVTNIVDGDTIDVSMNGQTYRVRYIGINTPESNELCGSEATTANANLVAGRTVRMERDVSETDRFGRLLRYIYLEDGRFVNGELVAGGWAQAVEYPPDTALAGVLNSLEAQGAGVGCALVQAPQPTAPPAEQPQPTAQAGNCDPSYPTVCIPPAPPDLDCKDVPYTRFQVLPPDPHNFDGNHDGVGCEG